MKIRSLREQIGIVPQETALFSGSVGDNIRYGKLDATQAEIEAAAQAANAHDFIWTCHRAMIRLSASAGSSSAAASGSVSPSHARC